MIVHEVFAQVVEEEVKNIIVCDNYPTADYLTKCIYGNDSFAVDCLQYRCMIGDRYHDGVFWRADEETGKEIELDYVPTPEQQVEGLESKTNELIEYQAEMLYEMSLMKLGIEE